MPETPVCLSSPCGGSISLLTLLVHHSRGHIKSPFYAACLLVAPLTSSSHLELVSSGFVFSPCLVLMWNCWRKMCAWLHLQRRDLGILSFKIDLCFATLGTKMCRLAPWHQREGKVFRQSWGTHTEMDHQEMDWVWACAPSHLCKNGANVRLNNWIILQKHIGAIFYRILLLRSLIHSHRLA